VVGFTSAAVGYAHPYFHAAKRRNCFHPDTEIEYRDGGSWRTDTIEGFVEARLESPRTDDFGVRIEELDDGPVVRSVTDDGRAVTRPATAVSKHPAPEHLVSITTTDGRRLRVTPDHRMLRWTGDGIERVRATEIEPGDSVPQPAGTDDGTAGRLAADGGHGTATVDDVEYIRYSGESVYCLEVDDTHTVEVNGIYTAQCDGDEDCVMLLLDGLLNFSKYYLPDQRGGRMDAPLVMSSRIDPAEIDDEAHNVDIVESYPREFYEATREMADPGEVDITIAESTLGTDDQYRGFRHTHDTADIALGPDLSAYKTLDDMDKKMDGQLELARKIRAVDETDVAERIIEYHFLPDLIGNLRAFSRQETRCRDCGEKYRRMPLSGDCRECGGEVSLTVYQGSVNKYMETAMRVAEEYGARPYTKQRLEILNRALESIFENDHNKQSGIGDFM
jgi:DNA polymerase II large subunit